MLEISNLTTTAKFDTEKEKEKKHLFQMRIKRKEKDTKLNREYKVTVKLKIMRLKEVMSLKFKRQYLSESLVVQSVVYMKSLMLFVCCSKLLY